MHGKIFKIAIFIVETNIVEAVILHNQQFIQFLETFGYVFIQKNHYQSSMPPGLCQFSGKS
jgi:hypothetical protein